MLIWDKLFFTFFAMRVLFAKFVCNSEVWLESIFQWYNTFLHVYRAYGGKCVYIHIKLCIYRDKIKEHTFTLTYNWGACIFGLLVLERTVVLFIPVESMHWSVPCVPAEACKPHSNLLRMWALLWDFHYKTPQFATPNLSLDSFG